MGLKLFPPAIAALSVSACALPGPIHNIAVDYNQAVANSANEVTFLNIVRASERQPMHFTSISSLTGSLSVNASGKFGSTLNVPAAGQSFDDVGRLTTSSLSKAKEVYSPSIDASISSSPSFNVAVHDTQTFYNGIATSVSPGMIAHFLHQGWREDLLGFVFVERVNLYARDDLFADGNEPAVFSKGELVGSIINDPDDQLGASQFAEFLNCFPISPSKTPTTKKRIFSLSDLTSLSLKDVLSLDGRKFDVTPVQEIAEGNVTPKGNRFLIRKSGGSETLTVHFSCTSMNDPDEIRESIEEKLAELLPSTRGLTATSGNGIVLKGESDPDEERFPFIISQSEQPNLEAEQDQDTISGITVGPYQVDIVLRSIQGVFYYLGEYARPRAYCPYTLTNGEPLLVVHKEDALSPCHGPTDKPISRAVVETRLDGERYWIPSHTKNQPHRSMQVISLVQQLLNLQKTAEERPTTQTVRVVE